MPFAKLVAWFVVASVVGQPIADMSFHWDPLALVVSYLTPLVVFGFLVVLYRESAHLTPSPRLGDAALAACILLMVALAATLRWPVFSYLFSSPGPHPAVWLAKYRWMANVILEPVAWLWFLVTFVRSPGPPLSRSTRRAALWLASFLCLGVLIYASDFVQTLVLFWWDFPPRGSRAYDSWNGVLQGFIETLRLLLLLIFAVAAWRIRPPE